MMVIANVATAVMVTALRPYRMARWWNTSDQGMVCSTTQRYGLERVQKVIGSHLERFGQFEGLTVEWCEHT